MVLLGAHSLLRFSLMSEKATPAPRPRFGSVVDHESSRMTQLLVDSHTAIIRGLSLLAPRSRRSRVRWILLTGVLAVVGVLAADRSSREFLSSKGRDFYRARIAAAVTGSKPTEAPAAALPPAAPPVQSAETGVVGLATMTIPPAAPAVAGEPAPPVAKGEAPASPVEAKGARSNRTPKARGTARPRTTSPQGGT
jgi:hypothetical protein